jgi:hypothetical protein
VWNPNTKSPSRSHERGSAAAPGIFARECRAERAEEPATEEVWRARRERRLSSASFERDALTSSTMGEGGRSERSASASPKYPCAFSPSVPDSVSPSSRRHSSLRTLCTMELEDTRSESSVMLRQFWRSSTMRDRSSFSVPSGSPSPDAAMYAEILRANSSEMDVR